MKHSILLKITFLVSFIFFFTYGFTQTKNHSQSLYPSENAVVKYHNDWTKKNYKIRIEQFKEKPLNFGDIVFLGNSITQQGRDWSMKFGMPNISNRGIAGDVTDGVLLRLKEITHFKPKSVFLLIGINDLFNLKDKNEIPSTEYIANNIIKIAATLHKESPKTKIYVQTILPTSHEYLRESIQSVNKSILQNKKKGAYEVIDLHSIFADEKDLIRKEFTTDGVHLNDKGYAAWVKFISPIVVDNKNNIQFVYPDGKVKSLIMSYDDGLINDLKLVQLFENNQIVGTFNLNSGYLGTTQPWKQQKGDTIFQKYISKDSLNLIFKNNEIASHGTFHKNYKNVSDNEILEDVNSDILNLAALSKRKIKSFAYPFGSSNEHIVELIAQTGITNARTVKETNSFNLPENYLLWNPTCHDSKSLDLLDNYLSLNNDTLSLFYVWGHSWEFRDETKWNNIVQFCQKAGKRKDIWYVGCSEFTDYQKSLKALIITDEYIENPKDNQKIWYRINGLLKILNPKEKIAVSIKL